MTWSLMRLINLPEVSNDKWPDFGIRSPNEDPQPVFIDFDNRRWDVVLYKDRWHKTISQTPLEDEDGEGS